MKKTKAPSNTDATPALTKAEITRAAFNDSSLSRKQIQLGDRTFPVKDLSYDQYNKFLLLIAPLADGIIGKIGQSVKTQDLGLELLVSNLFSVADIFKYCADTLPELATIVLQASDPSITIEQTKALGKTPFKLAEIVMVQLVHNNTIKDFSDFFARILPLVGKK